LWAIELEAALIGALELPPAGGGHLNWRARPSARIKGVVELMQDHMADGLPMPMSAAPLLPNAQ